MYSLTIETYDEVPSVIVIKNENSITLQNYRKVNVLFENEEVVNHCHTIQLEKNLLLISKKDCEINLFWRYPTRKYDF